MNEKDAISQAIQYMRKLGSITNEVCGVRRVTAQHLIEQAKDCPDDLVETYQSVLKTFRNRWVVDFLIPSSADEVICPGSRSICVYDSGEVEEASNM
jgi:hypothetical protein